MREGNQRLRFGQCLCSKVELPKFVVEMVFEQQEIDLAFLAHRIEIERCERGQRVSVEPFHASLARGRRLDREEAAQRETVEGVSLDHRSHLACRAVVVGVARDGDLSKLGSSCETHALSACWRTAPASMKEE